MAMKTVLPIDDDNFFFMVADRLQRLISTAQRWLMQSNRLCRRGIAGDLKPTPCNGPRVSAE
jgi:hypothetical protein